MPPKTTPATKMGKHFRLPCPIFPEKYPDFDWAKAQKDAGARLDRHLDDGERAVTTREAHAVKLETTLKMIQNIYRYDDRPFYVAPRADARGETALALFARVRVDGQRVIKGMQDLIPDYLDMNAGRRKRAKDRLDKEAKGEELVAQDSYLHTALDRYNCQPANLDRSIPKPISKKLETAKEEEDQENHMEE